MSKDPTRRQLLVVNGFVLFTILLVFGGIFAVRAGALPEKLQVVKMGGDIDISEVPDGGNLRTMGGNIHVGKAHNDITLTTMGGSIKVESADSSVNATTMGGDINLTLTKEQSAGSHAIILDSKSGAISLTVPRNYPMTIKVVLAYTKNSAGNYKITNDLGLEQSSSKDWDQLHGTPRKYLYARGRTGNGQNHVTIKTINGNVTIKEARPLF